MKEIADFIINTVQKESTGFQLIVSYHEIAKEFKMFISENTKAIVGAIAEELIYRKEVAQVYRDDYGFDVVLFTAYAPNYIEEERE